MGLERSGLHCQMECSLQRLAHHRQPGRLGGGGRFCHHMAAKDGSAGFDFTGTFTRVEAPTRLSFVMDDGREVDVQFASEPGGTWVQETFDAETSHTPAQQQAGWQGILDNFKRYVEAAG